MRGAAVRSETPDAAEKEDVSHASSNPWPPQQNNDKTTEVPSAPTAQTNPPKCVLRYTLDPLSYIQYRNSSQRNRV